MRFALWVQGCSIRCPGCFNPDLFATRGGTPVDPIELAEQIISTDGIEGVTFLGGEPFDQPSPLAEVAARVQAVGLTVMAFTGYWREDLETRRDAGRLLTHVDLLVDGPFEREHPDHTRPWVGSVNQRFWFGSDAYGPEDLIAPDRVEVRVAIDGVTTVNGWADDDALDRLLSDIGRRAPRTDRSRRS